MLSKRITFTLLLILFVLLASYLSFFPNREKVSASSHLVGINFQPTSEDFPNPERGFMKQSSIWLDQSFSSSKIARREPSDTIVWVYFRLDNYRDRAIDANGLNIVRSTFNTAREKGFKLVIRFIYNWGPGSTPDPNQATPDAPLNLALQHISQLKPLLIEGSDVIATMQAGFVGHWGEWHSSKYMYTLESKQAILDTLLNTLPKDRMLQIRYPRYKQVFYQGPITASEAFSESDRSRTAHQNDCFLSNDTDSGTYRSSVYGTKITNYCDNQPSEVQCWKDFIATEAQFTPNGGETCNYNPPRTDCPTAKQELEMLHWSFINNGYYPETLTSWKTQGCWNEIRLRLGYRFVLDNLNISYQVNPGGAMDFQLKLHNEGFASMYNERPVFIVLENKNTGKKDVVSLSSNSNPHSTDPLWWQPGQSITINEKVYLPSNLAQGSYNVYLWLPDAYESIRNRPEYAIHFANQNVWQSNTGYNLLFNNLQVGGPPVTQPPTNTPTPTNQPPGTPGDGNNDGVVDGKDFIIWLMHFNQNLSGANNGDYNDNGTIELGDYVVWINNFGT